MEELWEEVNRLRSIREDEREIDRIFSETQQLEEPQTPSVLQKQAVSGEGEGWKLVTSGTKRKAPVPPKGLQLQNRFTALKVEEDPHVPTSKGPGPPNPKPCKTTRKKQRIIVMGQSLLRGTEAPIC